MRAEDCRGGPCRYPRCNACLRKDGAPDCEGSGCAEPRCRTCGGTETDREEEKRFHKAQEWLTSSFISSSFAFPNPAIPDYGKVNGGQPSVSRPATPQAWVDNWMPHFDEKWKCKTCKNWERYWKRASTLTDEERRQQDQTKLHYFFGKSGTCCTCAPEDMAQRVVREYHLHWEPKDKKGKAINFRTFGPFHVAAEVILDQVKAEKRFSKTVQATMSRNKRRREETDLIWDMHIQNMLSKNAVIKRHNNARSAESNNASMPKPPFVHPLSTLHKQDIRWSLLVRGLLIQLPQLRHRFPPVLRPMR